MREQVPSRWQAIRSLSNKRMNIEPRFKKGDTVAERIYPARKLVISYYSDRMYYCKPQENQHLRTLVYFERDLMAVGVVRKRQIGL
jgi:hypothetical protein